MGAGLIWGGANAKRQAGALDILRATGIISDETPALDKEIP